MNQRIQKINALIQQALSEILMRELSLKSGVFLTIGKVDTSPDLRYTRIFVSVFPFKEANYAMKTIEHEKFRLQGALNKKLQMKPLPRLQFTLDETEEHADIIEKILLEI
jgi:ribosome-binding factor A